MSFLLITNELRKNRYKLLSMRTFRTYIIFLIALLVVGAYADLSTIASTITAENRPAASAMSEQSGSNTQPYTLVLEPSYIIDNVSGNSKRFEQYAIPPEGLVPGMSYNSLWPSGQSLSLDAPYLDNNYQNIKSRFLINPTALALDADWLKVVHFNDFTNTGQPITRTDADITADLRFSRSDVQFSQRNLQEYTTSRNTENDWSVTRPSIDLAVPFVQGVARVGYTNEHYDISGGTAFSGERHELRFRLNPIDNAYTSLEAAAAFTQTQLDSSSLLPNLNSPNQLQVNLHGTQVLLPSLALNGTVAHENNSNVITQNGYEKSNVNGELQADYTGIARTQLSMGYGVQDIDYVNNPQTLLYKSCVDHYFAGLTTRPFKILRIKGQFDRWNASGLPEEVSLLDQPLSTSILWSHRTRQQVEVSCTPFWRLGMSAGWQRHDWESDSFVSTNALTERNVNMWLIPRDNVTIYSTYLMQEASLFGINTTDGSNTNDDNSLIVGMTMQMSPALSLDISYNTLHGNGQQVSDTNFWGIGMFYTYGKRGSFELRLSSTDFKSSDNEPSQNYKAGYSELKYNLSF